MRMPCPSFALCQPSRIGAVWPKIERMHMLLVTLGSAGDVHPFVGLGIKLRQRGHRVTLVTSGYFQPLVQRTGLEFEALGTREEFIELASKRDLWHPRR